MTYRREARIVPASRAAWAARDARAQEATQAEPPIYGFDARPPRATWPTLVFALVGALVIAGGAIWLATHGG